MKKIYNLLSRQWALLTLLLLLTITLLSLWPAAQLPSVPGGDKSHHFIAYAALALPVAIRRVRGWWMIILFFVCYSGAIELIQPYVNRYGEWLDLLANTVGLCCGIGLAALFRYFHVNRL